MDASKNKPKITIADWSVQPYLPAHDWAYHYGENGLGTGKKAVTDCTPGHYVLSSCPCGAAIEVQTRHFPDLERERDDGNRIVAIALTGALTLKRCAFTGRTSEPIR